ncbi:GerAB/ArcD/ProY family transporter [Paenibacillus sp. KS-LC4]|uniref:GerAB/ArcD/ProY family transporter n=1 Tax=Paenibacillus sp. KS-LC4 TaxID=2979727 RepID=UPI0030CC0765
MAFMFHSSIMQIREISDFVTIQILIETPIIILCLLLIFPLALAIHGGIRAVGRAGETIFPVFVILFVLLLVLILPSLSLTNLLPIWGAGATGIIKGSIFFVGFPFCELFAFLMIFPNVVRSKHRARDYMLGVLIGGLAVWMVVLLCMLMLGSYITQHSLYAPYIMAKKINIGNFIQRLEAIFAISFIITSYFRSLIYGYAFVLGVAQLFKLRDFRILTIPFAFMAFGYSYVVSPGIVFFNWLVIPCVLWILTYSPGLLLLGWGLAKLRGRLPKKEMAD